MPPLLTAQTAVQLAINGGSTFGDLALKGPPHTCGDPLTTIVFPFKYSAMYSCLYVFDEKKNKWIEWKLDTSTHTVMPASIELSNYYFHQISSFCCINVLLYYAVLITGCTYRSLVAPLAQDRPTLPRSCTRLWAKATFFQKSCLFLLPDKMYIFG